MPVQAPLMVEVQDAVAPAGGLINVLASLKEVHDIADSHIGGGATWQADECGLASFAPGVCDDALGLDPETEKNFDSYDYSEVQPFGLYKGIECNLFRDDYEGRTRRAFDNGESVGVEAAFSVLNLQAADTTVLSGTAQSVVNALAILEDYASTNWGARPVIHVSRFGATYLADERYVFADSDFHLWTRQGTPVVNGGGITREGPTGEVAVTGSQFYIYMTGPVHLWRGPWTYSEAVSPETNQKQGLGERLYSLGHDCGAVAILVDPTA